MSARAKLVFLAALATAAFLLPAAGASAAGSWWQLGSGARPAHLPAEGEGEIVLTAENLGHVPIDGSKDPIEITDTLPQGLIPVSIAASQPNREGSFQLFNALPCELATLTCSFDETLPPYLSLEVRIGVVVELGTPSGVLNRVEVSGGAIPSSSLSRPLSISTEPTPFGLEEYGLIAQQDGGSPAIRAGSHPFQVTGTVAINQGPDQAPVVNKLNKPDAQPVLLAKDVLTKLPPGLIGDPTPFPTCSLAQFLTNIAALENACPAQSALGVAVVTFNDPGVVQFSTVASPVVNLEPSFGEPARFGFLVTAANAPVPLDTSIRSAPGESAAPGITGPDYGIDVNATNIAQVAGLISARVTFWGTPGDPAHDLSRGAGCIYQSFGVPANVGYAPCLNPPAAHPPAFLSMPTRCDGPLQSSLDADSWDQAGAFSNYLPAEPLQELVACNQVPFSPTIHSEPTSNAATSPTGLNFDINVNDEGLHNSEGLAQSQIKRAVVTLPQGFTTNPSVAEGLSACSEAQYESETVNSTPGSGCPNASKIGDVTIESPLVSQKVLGSLFVAKQGDNPNHNLLTIYMVAKSAELGILIKQALKVTPNPVTGQLTTEVDDIPQLPFSHFQLSFRQGQRSPLITPPACGTYTVSADLYPWSNPTVPRHEESSFQITQGPEGQGCPSGGVPPFHPGLEAGTQNNAAGTYSPFYTHISRKDSEQEITHFSIKLPPGVIGKLAGVSSCSDAQIAAAEAREKEGGGQEELNSPSCPANSEVGHSLVGSGVGNVLAYAPGKLYLAGPYHGSNLSIVSITAAKVGPFDLGTVVVRFALRINPETAEVFVDATGSDPIPHIVDGIPVHLRDIRAYVSRPEFTLNPTGCDPTSTASTVLGSGLNFASEADDQPVTVSSPFQAADCANLGFKPKLALSLKGGTKRGDTPKFKAVVTYPKGGAYSNIASAQVTLPHSEFLDNAHIKTVCTRVQFKEGTVPGEKCPAGSVYGFAKAITPLLSEPVEGPVYLRSSSHQLPDLVAALHNKQVDFALDGHVEGVKGGIRNTFETVPDAPVTKFTLEMQGGNKGLLENSTNLCARPHRATSDFTGHNGKVYDTKPVLAVSCPKKHRKGHKRSGAHQ